MSQSLQAVQANVAEGTCKYGNWQDAGILRHQRLEMIKIHTFGTPTPEHVPQNLRTHVGQ